MNGDVTDYSECILNNLLQCLNIISALFNVMQDMQGKAHEKGKNL